MSRARTRLLVAGAVAAALLAGCSSSSSTKVSTKGASSGGKVVTGTADSIPVTPANAKGCRTPEALAKVTTAPTVTIPKDLKTAPYVTDDIPGCGKVLASGANVTMQYVLKSTTTGQIVDSSWKSGQPFTFQLGSGQVIPGWDKGIPGMRAGGRRTLVLPPADAYGAAGSPPAIPADDTLVFVIDAVSAG